jgi:hypothetical protein
LTRKTGFTGQGFWSVEDNGYGMAQTELHDLQSNAFVFPRWLSPDVFFDDSNGTVVRVNLSQP